MKKILIAILPLLLLCGISFAQQGNNQIGVGVEANFFASNGYSNVYNAGFGGNAKGLYGVGTAGQLTLTAGYSSFSGKGIGKGQTLSLIPVLAGYRYNFTGGFYGEGQLGVGAMTTKGDGFSFSQTNFAGALNVGYVTNGFDISARYYTEGDVVSLFAIRVAYNFSLK